MGKTKSFIGIDVGTQGVRLVLIDEEGVEHFQSSIAFDRSEDLRLVQQPTLWWELVQRLMGDMKAELAQDFFHQYELSTIGVTSTSGTIVPLDREGDVLYGAIMYSDDRSRDEAAEASRAAQAFYKDAEHFTTFNSSCGLPKMMWFKKQFPELYDSKLWKFIYASDFITGKLTGVYDVTDHSNVLKSGYDLWTDSWPSYISDDLGIDLGLLSTVKPIGSRLSSLRQPLADEWGFENTPVVSVGLTDGCASQIASGAVNVGDWNTTIGTTLVLKGVTEKQIYDEAGTIYCHKHPDGYWMPGGASNIGADWVNDFPDKVIADGSSLKHTIAVSDVLYYPLKMKGERFPFKSDKARALINGEVDNKGMLFQAGLEGVAFIERYAYEKLEGLIGSEIKKVFSAGGGNHNERWLKIRASVLNRPLLKSERANGAVGAAIAAASSMYDNGIREAAALILGDMVTYCPDLDLVDQYEQKYHRFIKVLQKKGYINE